METPPDAPGPPGDPETRGPAPPPPPAHAPGDLRAVWEVRRGRFHDDARAHTSRWVRGLYHVGGALSLAAGAVGLFLPVVPTTPFLLLAAACYLRASPRLYNALLSNRAVGPALYAWRSTRTVPPKVKVIAIAVVLVTFTTSIAFAVRPWWGRALMGAIGVALVVLLARLPTAPPHAAGEAERRA